MQSQSNLRPISPSRSPEGQVIHTAICGYIFDGGITLEQVETVFKNIYTSSPSAFRELSANGFSHLMDIYHLCFQMEKEKAEKQNVCQNEEWQIQAGKKAALLQQLLFKVIQDRTVQQFLLVTPNQAGFTPLHTVLKEGSPANVAAYLVAVQKVVSGDAYVQLLVGRNQAGFTPLHAVLKEGNPANVTAYLAAVQAVVSGDAYVQLLVGRNQAGFTLLHQVLKEGTPANVTAYLAAVQVAVSGDAYVQLLVGRNQAGFTPLHEVLIEGNPANVMTYSAEVKALWEKRSSKGERLLSTRQFKELLVRTNQAGFTPLHQVASSGKIENLRYLIQYINNTFEKDEVRELMQQLLFAKTKQGYVASCPYSKVMANEINHYLDNLRKTYCPTREIYTPSSSLWNHKTDKRKREELGRRQDREYKPFRYSRH